MDHSEITEWNLSGVGSQEAIQYLDEVTEHLVTMKAPYSLGTGKRIIAHRDTVASLKGLSVEGGVLRTSIFQWETSRGDAAGQEDWADGADSEDEQGPVEPTSQPSKGRFAALKGIKGKVSSYKGRLTSSSKRSSLQPRSQAELAPQGDWQDEQESGVTGNLPSNLRDSLIEYQTKVNTTLAGLPDYPEGALEAYEQETSRRLSEDGPGRFVGARG